MSKPLRVLLVEDSENDALLDLRALTQGGYEVTSTRVETAEAMRQALAARPWDVIISDHALPQFSAPAALEVLQATGGDIPFLVVSGTIGEEKAVALMRAGARDYISKSDLARLAPVVDRELAEAANRREMRKAEAARQAVTVERDALLRRLQLQIERMPLAYVLFNADCRVIDWNPAAERMLGYRKDEVLGLAPPYELCLPSEAWKQSGKDLLDRIQAGDMAAHGPIDVRAKDGRVLTIDTFNTPLVDENGRWMGFMTLGQDITERKQLEERYRQAQKMEALGQLAGGVAHDFNNLLTIINGYCDLLLHELGPDHSARPVLQEIRKAGERSAGLTRQLLIFSRRQVITPRPVDLNTVVTEMEKMLRRTIGEDVKLVTELGTRLRRVWADPGQIEQILLNLILNARDAMPRGGQVTITTANRVFEEGYTRPAPDMPAGEYVLLEIRDTGVGMTPEVRTHLFEPFFTTKAPGKGTGLGLATVYGIVQQGKGYIVVQSRPGEGAAFSIYFPAILAGDSKSDSAPIETPLPRGNEVILLAEDDDGVRRLTGQLLVRLGYTVLEARNGREALELAGRYPFPIPLVITDVVMPELGGCELVEALLRARPESRVLFVSGYTGAQTTTCPWCGPGGGNFLQKPYTPRGLACKVRELLDAAAPSAAKPGRETLAGETSGTHPPSGETSTPHRRAGDRDRSESR